MKMHIELTVPPHLLSLAADIRARYPLVLLALAHGQCYTSLQGAGD